MDEAQEALTKTDEFIVAKHLYESSDKNKGSMVCFFEGKHDKDYYMTRIRTICGDAIEITCNCKKNVLQMYDEIPKEDRDKYRLAYFIDRDFDEPLNNPEIFETEGYSIENYYCTETAFHRILTEYFYLDLTRPKEKDTYDRAMNFYKHHFGEVHKVVAQFNHYYSAIKRKERELGEIHPIELGDSFPSELGSVEVNSYNKCYSLESLNSSYGTSVSYEDLEFEKSNLDLNPFWCYRGKYELQALEGIVTYIIKEAEGQRKTPREARVFQKNTKKTVPQPGSLLLTFSTFAEITQKLRDYLKRFEKVELSNS